MIVYGLDFTSAPSRRKPITCARGVLEDGVLRVQGLSALPSFAEFEAFLAAPGPWVAALDFPFGLPRRLIEALGWRSAWSDYVGGLGALGKAGFERLLEGYKANRPAGDREHKRATDIPARAASPQKLVYPPVGKMFFEGAPRLLASGVCVVPCRDNGADRVVFEGYPALVAEKFGHRRGYKAATAAQQTRAQRDARRTILAGLRSPERLRHHYGFAMSLGAAERRACLEDGSGDRLDALLAAVQGAWAYRQGRRRRYGLPREIDRAEGWIADPALSVCRPPRPARRRPEPAHA